MSEHNVVRILLPLAASGDISPDELRQVNSHLEHCGSCRRAAEDFASLAGALRGIPTPQPRPELLERVHRLAECRLGRPRSWREEAGVLAPLVAASWITALATWPLVRAAGVWILTGWHLPAGEVGVALGAYSVLGVPVACAALIMVGIRARVLGRAK